MSTPDALPFLRHARHHFAKVEAAAAADPIDWYDLTIYGFYCLEAATMAAASHVGRSVRRTHPDKAQAAAELARGEGLPNVSRLLRTLNDARKATAYGDMPLPPLDPHRLARDIESFVTAVSKLLGVAGR